jgi:FkbM family methyltransferase
MSTPLVRPKTYYSQIGQDAWVNSVLNGKRNGFFVELGACDGLYLSNTLYFERHLDWNGICIEPNERYWSALGRNRRCNLSHALVHSEPDQMVDFVLAEAASGIDDETGNKHVVKLRTSTLEQVLDAYNAPRIIDYLSLDVEGQEYNILSTFPFDKYQFRCLTVEHNAPHVGSENQQKIRDLLEGAGYRFVQGNDDINGWSHGPINDFYVHSLLH